MGRLEDLTVEARLHPEDWGVWCRLARALVEVGHLGAAREAVGRARALARDVQAWLEIGKVLDFLQDLSGAVAAYREATRLHRKDGLASDALGAEAYIRLGANLLHQGELDTAVLSLRVAVRLAPDAAIAHCRLAEGLERIGQIREALTHAERAVDLDFESADPHRILARVNARLGRDEDAIEALRQLTMVAPEDVSAVIELSTKLSATGLHEEGRGILERLAAQMDRSPENLFRLGTALSSAGDHSEAVKALREAIRMRPGVPRAHFALGETFEAAGAVSEAIVAYEAAVTLDPRWAEAHHRLGLALMASNRPEESVRILVQASALDPGNPGIRTSLARALAAQEATPEVASVSAPVPAASIGASEGSFTGDLSVFALTEVLEFLLVQRSSGRLLVRGPEGSGTLDLLDGQIAAARAEGARTLRQRLEDGGAWNGAFDEGVSVGEDDLRFAQRVAKSGRLERSLLVEELRQSVQEALAEMVSWRRGQVSFHAERRATGDLIDPELYVDPRWALLEIARGADEG